MVHSRKDPVVTFTHEAREKIAAYFRSEAWRRILLNLQRRNQRFSHCVVRGHVRYDVRYPAALVKSCVGDWGFVLQPRYTYEFPDDATKQRVADALARLSFHLKADGYAFVARRGGNATADELFLEKRIARRTVRKGDGHDELRALQDLVIASAHVLVHRGRFDELDGNLMDAEVVSVSALVVAALGVTVTQDYTNVRVDGGENDETHTRQQIIEAGRRVRTATRGILRVLRR